MRDFSFFLTSLVVWGLLSCSRGNSDNSCIAVESEIEQLDFANLSDLVSDFKIVPLETSDSLIIGRISKVKKRGDALYVQADDRLLKFSLAGDFERELIHKGSGPDEVLNIADFEVKGNNIYILTPCKLIVKDHINGEDYRELAVPEYVGWDGRLRVTDSGLLVIASNPQEGDNSVMLMDFETGKTLSKFYPAGKDWRLANGIELAELEKGKYIHQYGRSTDLAIVSPAIQKVDSLQLIKSDNAITAQKYSERNQLEHSKSNLGLETYHGLTSSGSHLFWMGILGEGIDGMKIYLYDKQTKATKSVPYNNIKDDLSWSDDMMQNQMIGMLAFNESDDNTFISILDPDGLKEAISGKSLKFNDSYSVLNEVKDDANPLIVFLEFKSK